MGLRRAPVVGDELVQPQRLSRLEIAGHDDLRGVALRRRADRRLTVAGDRVLHPAGHPEAARAGRQREDRAGPVRLRVDRDESLLAEAPVGARVPRRRRGRVGDELRADRDADGRVERDDLVGDGHQVPPLQRGEAARAQQHAPAARRLPLHLAQEHAVLHVEDALATHDARRRQVERLIVDEEPDDGPVGDVDRRLARPRHPEGVLRVDDRPRLVEAVEDDAGVARGRALLRRAAHAEVAVADGEDRFEGTDALRVVAVLDDLPVAGRVEAPERAAVRGGGEGGAGRRHAVQRRHGFRPPMGGQPYGAWCVSEFTRDARSRAGRPPARRRRPRGSGAGSRPGSAGRRGGPPPRPARS